MKSAGRLVMTRQWMAGGMLAALLALGLAGGVAQAADAPAATEPAQKLATGLTPTAQLLQLMDTDQNGKVSKEEFMRFMEAEFNYADKNKDNELDPKELKALVLNMNRPRVNGPGR
jgi:hypothetical protein